MEKSPHFLLLLQTFIVHEISKSITFLSLTLISFTCITDIALKKMISIYLPLCCYKLYDGTQMEMFGNMFHAALSV